MNKNTIRWSSETPYASNTNKKNHSIQSQTNTYNMPVLGEGENNALTYLHTGSDCLNLHFDVIPGISQDHLMDLLEKSWKDNENLTLKIIFQLGDPRNGKGDRKNLYSSLCWLYENHYDTFMLNIQHLPRFSCYKSLLDILQLVCVGPDALDDKRTNRHAPWRKRENRGRTNTGHMEEFFKIIPEKLRKEWNIHNCKNISSSSKRRVWRDVKMRQLFVEFIRQKDIDNSEKALQIRKQNRVTLREQAKQRLENDPMYSAFYNTVADIFATGLKKEEVIARNSSSRVLSGLVAKWAPNIRGSHNKYTNIVDGIVEKLYPESMFRLPGGTREDYLSFMRDRYRKEYVSPQRRQAEVPEYFTGFGDWKSVNYERMASRCRHIHGHIYEKHDGERYRKYLEDAKKEILEGKRTTKISSAAVLPHEITSRSLHGSDTEKEISNLQWMRLVQDTKDAGKLPSSIAICDVSASMHGKPMEVAVALSLLLSDIAPHPWKNKIITFSEMPEIVRVESGTMKNLGKRVKDVLGMDWGYNTNFQAVFDLLLDSAELYDVKPADMPQVLFCFSDMEFDCSRDNTTSCDWKTDYEQIREKYHESGYEMPHIVFWNIRASRSKPVSSSQPGVSMLSGFSSGMMKAFLANDFSNLSPLAQLIESLSPRYDCLVVADSDKHSQKEIDSYAVL